MNDRINKIVEVALKKSTATAVSEAVSQLLGESELKSGQSVALIDDDNVVGGYVGKGKVKGSPVNGQVEVEMPNGTSVWAIASLVVPL